jgi:hypothetical protein
MLIMQPTIRPLSEIVSLYFLGFPTERTCDCDMQGAPSYAKPLGSPGKRGRGWGEPSPAPLRFYSVGFSDEFGLISGDRRAVALPGP